MADVKAKKCTICSQTVNMLASYAQVSLGKFAHLKCVRDEEYNQGYTKGIIAAQEAQEARRLQDEREAKQRVEQEKLDLEIQLRSYISALPRCPGCGKRVNDRGIHRSYVQRDIEEVRRLEPEAVERGDGTRCRNCVEVERLARNEARRPQAAATAPPKADEKKPEERKDRFGVIEIE